MRKSYRKLLPFGQCTPTRITWEELVAHEPGLNDLLIEARSVRPQDNGYFCQDDHWHGGSWLSGSLQLKKRLHRLVGFGATQHDGFMNTCEAWDVAMETLLEAMPPCSKCGCCCADGSFTN